MRSRNNGFTLVELMFAVVIISISVLAVYQMFVQGSQMINEEYHRRLGLERAQAHIEIAGSYITLLDSIPRNLSGVYNEELVPPVPGYHDGIDATYNLRITHGQNRHASGVPSKNLVEVSYAWTEKSGRDQNIYMRQWFSGQ